MQHLARPGSWLPLLGGLCLLAFAARIGFWSFAWVALPASLLIAGGGRMLLSPDLRGPQHVAAGCVIGVLLGLPVWLAGGFGLAAATIALCVLSFITSGAYQIRMQPRLEEVPAPEPSPVYSARVSIDNAFLSAFSWMTPIPKHAQLREAMRESIEASELFDARGWLQAPAGFHREPPPLERVSSAPVRIRGIDCERIGFDSGYEPDAEIPGRDRWLAHRNNHTCHVTLLRHRQPAPWLVCVHGFGMGNPKRDLGLFGADTLHRDGGLNIAMFTLPVHGERAPGGFSGAKYMGLSPLDFVHAEAQAIHDLRRLIGWLERNGETTIGAYGISLGGYTCALLAGLERGLACVIAGVPPSDVLGTGELIASSIERRIPAAAGISIARDRALQSVVSPLALAPLVPRERRFMYAATGDQFVPIEQVRSLWLHWDRPRINWCTGGHVSALNQPEARSLVREAVATLS